MNKTGDVTSTINLNHSAQELESSILKESGQHDMRKYIPNNVKPSTSSNVMQSITLHPEKDNCFQRNTSCADTTQNLAEDIARYKNDS